MGSIETGRMKLSLQERGELMQEIAETQRAWKEKMDEIVTYPGPLEELEKITKEKYEYVPIPDGKTFLRGDIAQWEVVDNGESIDIPIRLGEVLNPRNWRRLNFNRYIWKGGYNEVLFEAVNLNADALIHYTGKSGVPLRRISQDSPANP